MPTCAIIPSRRYLPLPASLIAQVHTTGIDIKQSAAAVAALTIGKDMTFRDLAQVRPHAWYHKSFATAEQRLYAARTQPTVRMRIVGPIARPPYILVYETMGSTTPWRAARCPDGGVRHVSAK